MTDLRAGCQRAEVVAALPGILGDSGWAWQGPVGATTQWEHDRGPKDLDIWCESTRAPSVRAAIEQLLPAARVEHADDPRRLRHTGWAVLADGGMAVVDVTFGDLRVGSVLLAAEADIRVDSHRFSGQAAAADLLIRPLLRGRIPPTDRIGEAQQAWAATSQDEQRTALRTWQRELGALAADVVSVLDGASPPTDLAKRARRVLLQRTLAPSGLAAAWKQRRSILPAGRRKGPLGHRTRGVVVAAVGTDGSGKSTVANELEQHLQRLGFTTRTAYFGMARGNLPGVGIARRMLGIATPGGEVVAQDQPSETPAPPSEHQALRKVAAWYYAFEYGWRYLSTVAGPRRRAEVVICDRYIYDLRESPWPGSPASAFVERLVPRPDVMLLPDAPAELIHARKPERSLSEQRRQQQQFRALLAESPGRYANIIVDTSGQEADATQPVVRAVLSAAHLVSPPRP